MMAVGDIVGQVDEVASQVDILELCGNTSHFTSKSISRSVSKRSIVSNFDKNHKISQ
jgi:hypothetical protein